MRNAAGDVLVLRTTYKATWEIPGGLVDPGEGPHEAAAREVHEELGVQYPLGRLLCVDFRGPWERNPRPMLHFLFDGGVIDAPEFTLPEDEIAEAAFLPLDVAAERTGPRVGRRLETALLALDQRTAFYLAEGLRL